LFRLQGQFIVNERGKVFDVSGAVDAENRNVIVHSKHGKVNQQWKVIYADKYPKDPVKGELNEKFGLYVERPFYIVSELPEHRYLEDMNNHELAIKTRNGRTHQVWWFDQKSLTIRSKVNNRSFNIQSNGRNIRMQTQGTNSRWEQLFMYTGSQF
jgi:hypothetical protein